jgi:hypothetical protein
MTPFCQEGFSLVEEKTSYIAFRGSEAYRTRLKIAAAKRNVSVQDLLDRLVEEYVFKPDAPPLPGPAPFTEEEAVEARRFLSWMKRAQANPALKPFADAVRQVISEE